MAKKENHHKRSQRQMITCKKIFAIYSTGKRSIPPMYKELLKVETRDKNPINRQFTKTRYINGPQTCEKMFKFTHN